MGELWPGPCWGQWCCHRSQSFYPKWMIFLYFQLWGDWVFIFRNVFWQNDKACTKYTFIAREMTLKWPDSPWLVSGWKRWQIFVTGHGVESIVHFVNGSGMVWHPIWECLEFKTWNWEAALCSIESFTMSRKLGVELCNPVTAFCVKLNCDDGKKSDVLFSLF